MAQATGLRALVIGGGIGGLTAGLALGHAGVKAVVFERANDLRKIQVGGGIHLWHNAMRAYGQLGLADRVAAVGSAVERQEFRNWRGVLLATWPVGDIGRRLEAPTFGVSRADLHRVLVGALDEGTLQLGAECTGFSQDADGVSVRFADGREERGDALIGADGISSLVHTQLHGPPRRRYAGYTVWQAIVDFDRQQAPVGTFAVLFGPGKRFAWYHIGGQRLYWFGVANAPEGGRDPQGRTKAMLLEHFTGWAEPIEAIIAATDEAAISRLDMADRKPLHRWGAGRVTLLGDAAHAMTFNVGQGACQAVEDAVTLAKCLKATPDVPAALREYETRRIPRTTSYVNLARRIGAMGRWEHPLACAARDRLMRLTFGGPALRQHERSAAYQV
jgi:2-polyprenyl-6-methoxyphenol hydroxylase-like FAD-dependent oxidoreductase